MRKKSVKQPTISKELHVCEFCKRKFHNETSFINHNCEKKRRWFNRDDPSSRLAFMSWARFYELNSKFVKTGTKKQSFKEFMDSRYYAAFMKFARHLIDLNVLEPNKFIDYVIKNNLPLDKWTHDIIYENYVNELLKREDPESALARNIELM